MMTRFLFALCAVFALTLPLQAQEASGEGQEVTSPAQAVSVEPTARDEQIADRILDILRSTGWYEAAQVEVKDGIVFLDGRTTSDDHKRWARDLASQTQDVVAVVNRIEVVQEANWSFAPALGEIKSVGNRIVTSLPLIVLALIILPLTWWLSALAAKGLRRWLLGGIASPLLRDIVSRAIALPIFMIGLFVVLQVAGLTQIAVSVIGGAGVLGIIVGFAFRDIAENFLASLLLSIRRPFQAGDYIEVAGMAGSVRSMNTRSTVLLSLEGNHIQIPNATIFKSTIVNYTSSANRRDTLVIGIGYDVSVARAQSIMLEVIAGHEAVLKEPEPMILVDNLGSSTVNIMAYYWVNAKDFSMLKVKSALLRQVTKRLTEEGVSMPDDAREVIFPQGVPILQLEGAAEKSALAIASQEFSEGAREAAAAAVAADEDPVHEAEGNLLNEQSEVERATADAVVTEEDGADLLSDKA
ncbi:mechanosensitive ion channel family protein [Litoreibacter arenae]|uniref:Small-conductance mechanosensitive channel n=1 Tax=Litoreibacter arenae DSM 19593 TaxID=1123360 RepID=S9Q933_9RHOB|nr:mechanosensitive ion channel family protein [Litoreibacter arenae]EPX77901.1 Potassium efflux system KefA protein / Small-conductance mechanosensitive channel [Litoreibacter arenae DSM 19593]